MGELSNPLEKFSFIAIKVTATIYDQKLAKSDDLPCSKGQLFNFGIPFEQELCSFFTVDFFLDTKQFCNQKPKKCALSKGERGSEFLEQQLAGQLIGRPGFSKLCFAET